jgi:hypothetical protein
MSPMISTRDLSRLPGIEPLRKLAQSLAMLDAIVWRDWEDRYYSFNRRWGAGEQMASMRDGSGDNWFCVFAAPGALFKGFAHESAMSPWRAQPPKIWPGVLESVPAAFGAFLTQPAVVMAERRPSAFGASTAIAPGGAGRSRSRTRLTLTAPPIS